MHWKSLPGAGAVALWTAHLAPALLAEESWIPDVPPVEEVCHASD